MPQHVLAGDIGGTKTVLALFAVTSGPDLAPLREQSFPSRDYSGLEQVIAEFLGAGAERVAAAAFGIAGPVVGEAVLTTNLPWHVRAAALSTALGGARVRLMNDLETTAYGALFLPPEKLLTLNAGVARDGNRAVIAAGTGLGEAFLYWDGTRHRPAATEGGHVDFAPRDDLEIALLKFLRTRYGRVSYERVVSGPGLVNILRFLDEGLHRPLAPHVRACLTESDPARVIGESAVAESCAACVEAVDRFVSLYGAQAGNLALTVMATGGVYVGGGVVTKLLPRMTTGRFMEAFVAKGRYADFMAAMPVRIILDPQTALIGAARAALALLG